MPLSPPPIDANGVVQPHDHNGILNTDLAIRRINPKFHVVPDKASGAQRLSSLVFKPSSKGGAAAGISVDLEAQIIEAGIDPSAHILTDPWMGAVAFQVGTVRASGMRVGFHPVEQNPYHGEIWGPFASPRTLAAMANWYLPLAAVAIV